MYIRDYRASDYESLLALTLEVFGPFWEESLRPTVGDTVFLAQDGDWAQDYRNHLRIIDDSSQGRFTFVAEDSGLIIGYVACQIGSDKPSAEIDILAVRADHRTRGIATQLCHAAFDRMRAAKCAAVWLGTGGDNFHAPARRLYESLGMTPFPNVLYYQAL